MGRTLRIGMYSQFFGATIGGGEKYLGVTAEAIRDAWPQHRLEIVTAVAADRRRYECELNLDLSGIDLRAANSRVTWAHRGAAVMLRRAPLYRDMLLSARAVRFTRQYDLFLPMVYIHPVFSRARRTVVLCQFPYVYGPTRLGPAGLVKRVYRLPYRALRSAFLGDEIASVDRVICQSQYVARFVREYWKLEPAVINPPIDVPSREPDWGAKGPIVLAVGRFFRGGHNKRHDVMIQAFRELCDGGLKGWELHLAGSVHDHGGSAGYFDYLTEMSRGYPIYLHGNAPYGELQDLYRRASIFWHAAGYGVDAVVNPANLEHFGMTTVEAMANGAVPVVIAAGGQLEVVEAGKSGFLWSTPGELRTATLRLIGNSSLRKRLGAAARKRSCAFARERFKREMVEQLSQFVGELES
jgi:glycosyltransferase involved in cell wall biosynthesis